MSQRHDRLSVIGALALAPSQQRIGLYFHVQHRNVVTGDMMSFVRGLHRQLRRPIILILDRWSVHRAAAGRLQEAGCDWLEVEWLPPYAPELNPVEYMWSHAKYSDLANRVPDDRQDLEDGVVESLCDQYYEHDLKRSFFHAARLSL